MRDRMRNKRAPRKHQRPKLDMSQLDFHVGRLGGKRSRLTQRTKRKHVSMLLRFQEMTREQVLEYFELRLNEVKASTVASQMNSLCGAETKNTIYGVRMKEKNITKNKAFQEMQKYVQHLSREEDVDYPEPLKKKHLLRVLGDLSASEEWEALCFLLIQWATTARPNCVYLLRPDNLVFGKKNGLSVLFLKGKGVTMRQSPYTVHTQLPPSYTPLLISFVENVMGSAQLFETPYETLTAIVRSAMRKYNPDYEMRSPRRGSLCCMARKGVSLSVLRQFSGHTTDRMILRYLGWGMSHGSGMKKGEKAATHLW
jgi:hypothetical protein